jgi:hypothetical protein
MAPCKHGPRLATRFPLPNQRRHPTPRLRSCYPRPSDTQCRSRTDAGKTVFSRTPTVSR